MERPPRIALTLPSQTAPTFLSSSSVNDAWRARTLPRITVLPLLDGGSRAFIALLIFLLESTKKKKRKDPSLTLFLLPFQRFIFFYRRTEKEREREGKNVPTFLWKYKKEVKKKYMYEETSETILEYFYRQIVWDINENVTLRVIHRSSDRNKRRKSPEKE